MEVLDSLNSFYVPGIINLLKFLVHEKGTVVDATMDLSLVLHSIANMHNDDYSFNRSDTLVALASEFCLIDCIYEGKVLAGVEMLDNAVLFLGLHDEANYALEAAVCLSETASSLLAIPASLPSLSLFGHWEEFAATILACLLTSARGYSKMSTLFKVVEQLDIGVTTEIDFVDHIRKLCAVNLLNLRLNDEGEAFVHINHQPAGLILILSNRSELATRLADLHLP